MCVGVECRGPGWSLTVAWGNRCPWGRRGVFGAVGGPVAQETVPELPEEPGHLWPLPGLAVVRPLGGGAVPWDPPRGGGGGV